MPQVRAQGVTKIFTYGLAQPVEALHGVDFGVERGESVAVMGPSGAGKSTLLQIVGTLDRPTEGSVFYNDLDTRSLSPSALSAFRNKKIGFVFQFHHLLPEFSAHENVMMPALIAGKPFTEAKRIATEMLERVGLVSRLDHRPGELSGGEQQRVAVARAAALQPEIILADEPTGNLDMATGDKVFKLLTDLNREKNITLMVVTHSEALAARMGRVIRMADGKLVGEGISG